MRASHDCETFARVSHDSREIFVRASHDCRASVVLFLAIKSRNSLIYVAYLSHCADRGNFLAKVLR